MKLLEWMREENLDDSALAAKVNEGLPTEMHCSAYAVKKWKYSERRPNADCMIRIEEISGGKVALRDWASDAVAASELALP